MHAISDNDRQIRHDHSDGDLRHNQILRLPQVIALTRLSRSTVYLMIAEGRFPPAVALGARCRGWLEGEVLAWLNERVAERDLAMGE